MFLGVKAVIAKSFARIHKDNLINFGILPLVFDDPNDYDKIEKDDALKLVIGYYKKIMEKMTNELKELKEDKKIFSQIISHKMLPAMGPKVRSSRKKGRPTKYTNDQIKMMLSEYEHYHQENNDSKYAWNKVAEIHSIVSGKAAEMACKRWLKKQNK